MTAAPIGHFVDSTAAIEFWPRTPPSSGTALRSDRRWMSECSDERDGDQSAGRPSSFEWRASSGAARARRLVVLFTPSGQRELLDVLPAKTRVVVCQNSILRLDDGPAACEPWRAMSLVLALLGALRAALRSRTDLTLENLALRQQLALLRRQSKRPQFGRLDRPFWVWLSRRWAGWREAVHLVRPETVIRWHRQAFPPFWP